MNAQYDQPVSYACLICICEAMTGCDMTKKCSESNCGPFWISRSYWLNGETPTVRYEGPDSSTAYVNCRKDMFCSTRTVQGYMRKFKQDCNSDGVVDCDDYFAIHLLGGSDCTKELQEPEATKYKTYINAEYDDPVSPACLTRICKVMSGCRTSRCYDSYCGAFRMSRPFWVDGGMPTFKNEDPESEMAYENCAMDIFCSAKKLFRDI
ncbi:destabilase-related [Holotrichia oblita]|uniref:Destabilase-related n=1 Tax=Holotrichia oblita TaxID=644536 RepID=A0ACB9SR94_HOLOL|nr:destabilase-related [Holotrichia oblita]